MNVKQLFFLLAIVYSVSLQAQPYRTSDFPIIPKPFKTTIESGFYLINSATKVSLTETDQHTKNLLNELRSVSPKWSKLSLAQNLVTKDVKNVVVFKKDKTLKSGESYVLDIKKDRILITYKEPEGAFYAINSLKQLVNSAPASISCGKIEDSPRFAYRGIMLDVVRHFQPIEVIKKYIDVLSFYKINTLHLHLTDDQGWRIEIKKYPKLQTIAAFRNETLMGHLYDNPQVFEEKRYGGYYTQEDLKELVKYADSKYVTLVPEIELPGHATAAIAAYPELGCKPDSSVNVANKWGIFYDIFCPNEKTFTFLEDVLTEVIDIFPGKYIHIGGDEAPKEQWKASSFAQSVIKEHNLKNEDGLQSYFVHRIEKFLNSKGKAIIGWDEILDGGLAPNATVMSWRGEEGGIAAAKLKHNAIMTPHLFLYLDKYQTPAGIKAEPLAIGGYLPIEKVYSYDPIPEVLSQEEKRFIIGLQANIWTEYIKTADHLDRMTFPRSLAVAEVAWTTPENKNFDDFSKRLKLQIPYLNFQQVKYNDYFFETLK